MRDREASDAVAVADDSAAGCPRSDDIELSVAIEVGEGDVGHLKRERRTNGRLEGEIRASKLGEDFGGEVCGLP